MKGGTKSVKGKIEKIKKFSKHDYLEVLLKILKIINFKYYLMNIVIKPSHLENKKFDAVIDGGRKTIPFGAKGFSDMTQHKNEARKNKYIDRHKKRENWNDPRTAGFYSRWLIWNKPTLSESIKDTNKRFKNINVKIR